MGFHTYDVGHADSLEDESRYRHLSRDELLHAIEPSEDETVVDIGSGTGFYTDDVAPYVGKIYGVDLQEEMHKIYRDKGLPGNVELVTSSTEDLPFDDSSLEKAFSTMTYHEFANDRSLAEVRRVVDGRVVIADWSRRGEGESGPPLDERYSSQDAVEKFKEHSFEVRKVEERLETFVLVAE